jgi:type III restriction enzyme
MTNPFFDHPILNTPYAYPKRHWELDTHGQPTQKIIETRRKAEFITPIPKPRRQRGASQPELGFTDDEDISTKDQNYAHTQLINELRRQVDEWRTIPDPGKWRVTPETARLLQHWRSYPFQGVRPFFCQVEAAETAIWLTEVAPAMGKTGERFLSQN